MDSKVATFSAVGATQYDVAIGQVEHLVRGHEDARERVVEAPGHESGDQSLNTSVICHENRVEPRIEKEIRREKAVCSCVCRHRH